MARGRSTKLTKERSEKICKRLAIGLSLKDAALLSDVSEVSVHEWLKRGRKAQSGIHYEFLKDVEAAYSRLKGMHLQNLNEISIGGKKYTETRTKRIADNIVEVTTTEKVMMPDARTSKWLLARKFPDEWGERTEDPRDTKKDGGDDVDGAEEALDAYIKENGDEDTD